MSAFSPLTPGTAAAAAAASAGLVLAAVVEDEAVVPAGVLMVPMVVAVEVELVRTLPAAWTRCESAVRRQKGEKCKEENEEKYRDNRIHRKKCKTKRKMQNVNMFAFYQQEHQPSHH